MINRPTSISFYCLLLSLDLSLFNIYVYFLIYFPKQQQLDYSPHTHNNTKKNTSNFASANRSMKKISVHSADISLSILCQENVWQQHTQQQMRASGRRRRPSKVYFVKNGYVIFNIFTSIVILFDWVRATGQCSAGAYWTFITEHYRVVRSSYAGWWLQCTTTRRRRWSVER